MRMAALYTSAGTYKDYPTYDYNDFPYSDLANTEVKCRRKGYSYKANICTFDIETTTLPSIKEAYMYHWQVCIDGIVCTGRRWNEFEEFFRLVCAQLEVNEKSLLAVYIHNAGFEYQYMKHFLQRSFGELKVFAAQKRKPMRIECSNGLEFRCSWKLSNMSLEKFCESENVMHPKASGDLDYSKIRTADTPLDDREFGYCVSDVVGLYEAVQSKMRSDHDNMESIPMTSTGYVRRLCRRAAASNPDYRKWFESTRMTPEVYEMMKEAGRGGDTHANRYLAGRVLHDACSYDAQSSYPYVLMCKEFPMTAFSYYGEIERWTEFNSLIDEKACIFRVTLYDVQVHNDIPFPYISDSKCRECIHSVLDNGRILKADAVQMTITDIDWKIIRQQYDYDKTQVYIEDMYIAEYGRLPQEIRDVIIKLYSDKCVLKEKIADAKKRGDVKAADEYAYYYGKSKNLLNAIFGMMYSDPVRDCIEELEDGSWKSERPDIPAMLEKYYKSRNSFLYYAHGIWTTAHARAHLFRLVTAAGKDGAAYCDTDSCKGINLDHDSIDRENQIIMKEAEKFGALVQTEKNIYYMGIYEHETDGNPYIEFETLGAKKYAYRDRDGLHVTISGVNKKRGAMEMRTINNFRPGYTFLEAGGNELHYFEAPIHTITIDGCTMETASGIAVLDSSYTIGITPTYKDIIGYDTII